MGGRSYYENPASDLLAFFLNPTAEHGLGDLFLSTFLKCMEPDHPQLDLHHVDVHREVRTQKQNRIDLQIQGTDWCLLIENKIYHWQANPFPDYENYAAGLGKNTLLFAILSPNGNSDAKGWCGISYKRYCQALRENMAKAYFVSPFSKWHLFARELILHLENELYKLPMTEDQASFIEKHTDEITELNKLASDYRGFLQQQIREALSEIIPTDSLRLKDEGWAIRCYCSQWGNSNLALWREGQNFMVTAYLVALTDEQRKCAITIFHGMKHRTEGAWLVWYPQPGFETRVKAIKEVIRFSEFFNELFRASPEPVQPPKEIFQAGN